MTGTCIRKLLWINFNGFRPKKIAEVEDFVDFLQQRELENQMTQAAAQVAEPSFQNVWDNSEDAVYDRL